MQSPREDLQPGANFKRRNLAYGFKISKRFCVFDQSLGNSFDESQSNRKRGIGRQNFVQR